MASKIFNFSYIIFLFISILVEVHDEGELKRALSFNVECIGINNRNLKTLKIDLNTFKNMF